MNTTHLDMATIYLNRAEELLREARRMKLYQLLGLGNHAEQISSRVMWARAFNQVSIKERRKARGIVA